MRDGGTRAGMHPSPPSPSPTLPGMPHRCSAATSCVGAKLRQAKRGRRRWSAFSSSADRVPPGCANLLPCLLQPSHRRGPGDHARTAPGAMRTCPAPALFTCSDGTDRLAAVHALLLFAGPLVAAPSVCSDSPGAMEICQENNEIGRISEVLYKYSHRERKYMARQTNINTARRSKKS